MNHEQFSQRVSERVVEFINQHESKFQEYYNDGVKTVAHTILMEIENGKYSIDFLSVDEFTAWFDIDLVHDHEILDLFTDSQLNQVRDIISDYVNEHIIEMDSLDIGLYDESEFQDDYYDDDYEPDVLAEDLM